MADWTVAQALAALRQRQIEHSITYFYVVDWGQRLIGVIPTRRLLLGDPAEPVGHLAETRLVCVRQDQTLAAAMELFAEHHLLALPVVDVQGRLAGQLDVDLYTEGALDLAEKRRVADLFQLIGVSVAEVRRPSAWSSYAARMPWLLCNIAGGIACAVIAAVFGRLLAEVLLVAMFIPVVLTLSEAVSMQSMTLALQQLRGGRVDWRRVLRRSAVEWRTVLLLGVTSGLLVAVAAGFWGMPRAAGAIAASVALSMVASATVGTGLPTLLHALKLDPKVAAGPLVLAVGDTVTTSVYLALANWWLL
jgi:magnesium transporter